MGDFLLPGLRILAGASGLILIAAAVFLYEGEEKRVQSVFESWWVWIDDLAKTAVSRHQAFYSGVAAVTERALARLLGPKDFGLRAFTRLGLVQGAILCWPLIGLVPGFALLGIGWAAISPLALMINAYFFAGLLGAAVTLNLGMLTAVRFALREASRATQGRVRRFRLLLPVMTMALFFVCVRPLSISLSRIIGAVCDGGLALESISSGNSNPLVGLSLGIGLARGGNQIAETLATSCSLFSSEFLIAPLIVLSSLTGFLPATIYFVSLLGLLAHRLFWPLPNRILYALQRFRVLENRRVSWKIGVALLATAGAPWESAMRALESFF